jgi:hypothetical protein
MRVAAAWALVVAAAATGCGHSGRKAATGGERQRLERAIAAGRVAGSGSVGRGATVSCRPDPTVPAYGSVHVFQCRTGDVADLQFLSCQLVPAVAQPVCAIDGAPEDVRIFTTPALEKAPKDVTWKCEDQDDQGRDIGPVFISLLHRPDYPAEQTDWMTRAQAKAVTRAHHTRLGIDC